MQTLVALPPDAAGCALRAENNMRLIPGLRGARRYWVPRSWGSHSDEARHRLVTALQEALADFGAQPYPVKVLHLRLCQGITMRRTYARHCIREYQKGNSETITAEGAGTRAPGLALLLLARRSSRLLTNSVSAVQGTTAASRRTGLPAAAPVRTFEHNKAHPAAARGPWRAGLVATCPRVSRPPQLTPPRAQVSYRYRHCCPTPPVKTVSSRHATHPQAR